MFILLVVHPTDSGRTRVSQDDDDSNVFPPMALAIAPTQGKVSPGKMVGS